MGVYDWVYMILSYTGLEFITFVLVDSVVKSPLKDAVSDKEKRTIWLYESVSLGLICLMLYTFHHVPYLLILLTSVTFVYTQFLGRTGVTDFLAGIRAQWENHLQHEESMKQIERQKLQQQTIGMTNIHQGPAPDLGTFPGQNIDQNYGPGLPFLNKQPSLQYPPNATVVPGQDTPAYSLNTSASLYRDAVRHNRDTYALYSRNWNNATKAVSSITNTQLSGGPLGLSPTSLPHINSYGRQPVWTNLPRRSLHPNIETKVFSRPLASSIKAKVLNAVGLGSSNPRPIGLVNYGQNICFINSVVQCLARAPSLVESLTAVAARELECSVAESELISSLAELLDILTLPPNESHHSATSAARFRQACSKLHPQLVTPPGEHMNQQDAVEFLQWLLETLHSILNKNRQALESDCSNQTNGNRLSGARLANLKHIYGDLSVSRILELKEQCKRDIEVANGLDNESYAEAIQRLSDLEWLIYKQANNTVIDNLFTGQLVEASCGVNNGRISVNLQIFNVLPVPIGDCHNFSGLVMLSDCFANFCKTENMIGALSGSAVPNVRSEQEVAAQFSSVLRQRNINSRGLGATPVTRQNFRLAQKSDMAYVPSPIHPSMIPSAASASTPGVVPSQTPLVSPPLQPFMRDNIMYDSGFLDNTFRTSTPLGSDAVLLRRQEKIQRRCLLRQLPECLIIQLMRFSYDHAAGEPTKVSTSVGIRLFDLDLRDVIYDSVVQQTDLATPNSGYVYELYGLCLHLGASSTSHGHYVSYCLDRGRWYRMDDDEVTEVNMEYQLNTEEIRQNAYILFYKRTSASD